MSMVSRSVGITEWDFVWRGGITRGYNARMPASNRLLMLLFLFVLTGSLSAAEPPGPIEQDVLMVDTRRFVAMVSGDAVALNEVIAVEASYVNSDGRIDDKQSILYGIRNKTAAYTAIIPTERRVRVSGNIAVVRGVAAIRGVAGKRTVDLTVRYLATYERLGGRWQMTAGQSTEIVAAGTVISGESA